VAGGVNAQSEKWSSGQSKLANGDAEGAYRELLAFEGRFVGTPEYDYLLGLAALESGQRDITVLSIKQGTPANRTPVSNIGLLNTRTTQPLKPNQCRSKALSSA